MENKKELCSCKKDKILNKKIRELFIEEIDKLGQIVFKKRNFLPLFDDGRGVQRDSLALRS